MASEQSPDEARVGHFKYSKRAVLKTIVGRSDNGLGVIGRRVVVGGWVRSSREFKKDEPKPAPGPKSGLEPKDITCVEVLQTRMPFLRSIIKAFGGDRARDKLDNAITLPKPPRPSISILAISDGSCVASLRVVVDSDLAPPSQVMPTGTCIFVEGVLQSPSLQDKEVIELKADKILHIGTVDMDRYPLSRKRLPLESLRDCAHFRPRTTTVASVMRIRNALTQATHRFFQENGFLHVQVPIITNTNCWGSKNENTFHVTTLLDRTEKTDDQNSVDDFETVKLEIIKSSIQEKARKIEELKRSNSNKEALAAAIHDLKKTNELALQLEAKQRSKIGKSSHRTSRASNLPCLTVSGRMHLESYASALGNVYDFGPRFVAKRPDSKKLLAEMWMAELEMAFSELKDSMDCAIDFLKFVCKWILDNCSEDLKFVAKRVDKLIVDRLQSIVTCPFEKISYTEAVNFLKQVSERKFETEVEWGVFLSEEHESYLTDEIYKKPLVIYNHPKELKPFNVRINDDGKTAASFDIILPKVGTLIRGSQTEERFNMLITRIKEFGSDSRKHYEWYLELRKHGHVECSGFSFVFDPLVMYATGINDVRDIVPFPRSFSIAQ
ncbi:Asparagine--tRNA ligase- cytoplasmic 2 [Striga hermonthica]|uniref:Asparagine--tRNA ligase- cytoplasmic 2 n=1 Tax=Striga hermonthica TaxID=68872 RepID=A0A9N7NIM1_STRHE|nr:Asparagine--tRNA ligase- cytoplasmic 2 [Striga hermonthica]